MIAAAFLAAALAARAAADSPAPDPGAPACPAGTRRVATDDPYQPYRCALPGETPLPSALGTPDGPAGFTLRPICPQGTRPLATPNSLQPYRCVSAADAAAAAAGGRYAVAGGLSFEPPDGFRLQDDWKDDVPTLYLELAGERSGKPTSITITRAAAGQDGFVTLSAAVRRDEEWQGAKETRPALIGRVKARATEVAGTTRSVYLPEGRQSYYSFVYSAPETTFGRHLPDFERMLRSVRLERRP